MILKLLVLATVAILPKGSLAATDKVICYYASWGAQRPGNGKFVPEDIDANLCTHINYAFVGLNEDCTLTVLDEENDINQGGLQRVSALKEVNPNLKVLLSVGGATASPWLFEAAGTDPVKLEAMANSAIEFFETYGYDGLDVDWEYPYDKDGFNKLLQGLRAAFEPRGYLLTAAVNSIPSEVGGYDIPTMSEYLDVINVMTYDFHAAWAGYTAENSPLYGGVDESDWMRENRNSDAAIRYWIDGGADPQKVALGIAFYGRTYLLTNPSSHGLNDVSSGPGAPGPYTNNTGTLGYSEICEFYPNSNVVFLDDMKVPYLYEDTTWIGFDNEQSISEKVKYAKDMNLAGVFVWSIETDDLHELCGPKNGLLNSLASALRN